MAAPASTLGEGMDLDTLSALLQMGMSYEQAVAIASDPAALGALSGAPSLQAPLTSQQSSDVRQGVSRDISAQQEIESRPYRLTPEQQEIEDRYGNDMSWLDPSFQRTATTIAPITTQDAARYGTTADPEAQAQQRRAVEQLFGRASAGASGDERYAMDELRGSIGSLNALANRGATPEERAALEGMSGAAGDLLTRGRTGATTEERAALADQKRVLERLFGDYEQGASDVELEAQDAQRRAMGELFGLWEGGGATALERARRAQARAESENWLEGQRKADLQDLAERGMSGSGAELASLQADRQAAAQRLSMADLETDAALEERALQALLSGSGVAGEMLAGEGNIQARRLQQLFGAGEAARGVSGTLGGIEDRSTQQITAGGGILGNVAEGYGNIENRGLQARLGAANAANAYGGIAGSVEARALEALLGAERGATGMRNASDAYVGANADRLLNAASLNAQMINSAEAQNKAFLQGAQRDMIDRRENRALRVLDLQTGAAKGLLNSDTQDNQYGFEDAKDTATTDVGATNRGKANRNSSELSAFTGTQPAIQDASTARALSSTGMGRALGDSAEQVGQAITSYYTGGASTMGNRGNSRRY